MTLLADIFEGNISGRAYYQMIKGGQINGKTGLIQFFF